MALKSSSGGMTPASESFVAFTRIMNRIVVSPSVRTPGGRMIQPLVNPRSDDTTRGIYRYRHIA